jgi:hypothetical protein
MSSGRVRRALAGLVLLGALVGAAAALAAATVHNGSFENGFEGWNRDSLGGGSWATKIDPASEAQIPQPPPKGKKAAYASQNDPSSNVLYQDVDLKANRDHKLIVWVAYKCKAEDFATPDSLDIGPVDPPKRRGTSVDNEQFRIDVMDPEAPVRSVESGDVLKSVFRTEVGDPRHRRWFKVHANLSSFAGETVRLRFAEVDNLGFLSVGVDGVKVTTS